MLPDHREVHRDLRCVLIRQPRISELGRGRLVVADPVQVTPDHAVPVEDGEQLGVAVDVERAPGPERPLGGQRPWFPLRQRMPLHPPVRGDDDRPGPVHTRGKHVHDRIRSDLAGCGGATIYAPITARGETAGA